jgi:hypothetical protein
MPDFFFQSTLNCACLYFFFNRNLLRVTCENQMQHFSLVRDHTIKKYASLPFCFKLSIIIKGKSWPLMDKNTRRSTNIWSLWTRNIIFDNGLSSWLGANFHQSNVRPPNKRYCVIIACEISCILLVERLVIYWMWYVL